MTPRRPADPDAITLAQAASLLGVSTTRVKWLRRESLLVKLQGYPSFSN